MFYNVQIVTGSKRAIFKLLGDFSEYVKDIIIWDKVNAQPAMGEGVLNRQSELIIVFDKRNAISRKFNYCNFARGTLNDVWQIKRGKKVSGSHGATFPEELVENSFVICREQYAPFLIRRFILYGGEVITKSTLSSDNLANV